MSLLMANHNLPGPTIFAPNGFAITGDGHPVDHFFADRLFWGHGVVLRNLSGSPYAMTLHLNHQFTLAIIEGSNVIPGLRELFPTGHWQGTGAEAARLLSPFFCPLHSTNISTLSLRVLANTISGGFAYGKPLDVVFGSLKREITVLKTSSQVSAC